MRTVGGETNLEWRYGTGALGLVGSMFCCNDPAGTLLANRGWGFDGRPIGLFGEPRQPDLVSRQIGNGLALREEPFKELDGRPGWYAGASLRQDEFGRLAALYYDNRADPASHAGSDFGWRTKFTSLGLEVRRQWKNENLLMLGFSNGSIGYLPDDYDIARGSYAAIQSPKFTAQFPFTAQSGPAMVEGLLRALIDCSAQRQ